VRDYLCYACDFFVFDHCEKVAPIYYLELAAHVVVSKSVLHMTNINNSNLGIHLVWGRYFVGIHLRKTRS